MSFGWSAGDIFTLVVTCYKIVENCREGLASAAVQIGGLKNDLEEFSSVLLHLHNVVKEGNDIAFFDMKEMKKTIDACKVFIGKNSTGLGLKRRPSFSKGKEFLDNAIETGLKIKQAVVFGQLGGDQQLMVLQSRLARHRQTLVLYLQILERNRRMKEDVKINKRLSDMEAMVKDMHSDRRLSATGSPEIAPRSPHIQQQRQNEAGYEDYQAIFKSLNEQKRLALMETERPDNDHNLEEWNDILDHLEMISRRVLNAAERTASSTAQRRTGSVSEQISLNRMLTPHHTMGTPPALRPLHRRDTNDSGYAEMLPPALAPVREESSGLNEGFVQSGNLDKYVHPSSSFSEGMIEHHTPITPKSLLRQRTLSVNSISRPVISPSSSSESVAASTIPPSHSPRQSRTFSMSSSEVSFSSTILHWQVIQFSGWVKCSTKNCRKAMACTLNGGYDSNGQVYGLQIQKQDTNSPLLFMKLSTKKKRPVPHVEPSGERHVAEEGYQAYFISQLDTEPKDEEVQFFFQEEKSLNKFESLVYGQELILTINIKKISSSSKALSDSQRVRLWRKGDIKSLLFYPTRYEKTKGKYYSVLAREVHQYKAASKSSLELKLQNNSHHLQDLKIEFLDKSDLNLFSTHFLTN